MAKFEDYVKQNLDSEIEEAGEAQAARQAAQDDNIPERFRGKTLAEMVTIYGELEALNGRQTNELGQLRRTVDNLAESVNRKSDTAEQDKVKPTPVTVDDLYENADATVRRVAREESQSRIDELERRLVEAETRANIAATRAQFEKKHPDFTKTLNDPKFIEWIKESKIRMQLAQAADAGNFDAADELFTTYAALTAVQKPQTPDADTRRRQVKDASLESSGGSAPAQVEKFSKTKLQEMRIKARQGNAEAERWLQAHGDEIRSAYVEGRLVT